MNILKYVIIFLCVNIHSTLVAGEENVKVLGVDDYCTLIVDNSMFPQGLRLYGIDPPEKEQRFSTEARQFIKKAVQTKNVRIHHIKKTQYDHYQSAVFFVDKKCLNEELVKMGLAWVSDQNCMLPVCGQWKKQEVLARKRRLGIWSQDTATPPWKYRVKKYK